MRPAEYVIKVLGGVRATARALRRSPSTIHRWQKPRKDGGTGGQVPTRLQPAILKVAERRGLSITSSDLIKGRKTKRGKR